MQKNFRVFTPVIVLLMVLSVILTGITYTVDSTLFIVCAILTANGLFIASILLYRANRQVAKQIEKITDSIAYTNSDVFLDTSIPTLTVYEGGELIWFNAACQERVFGKRTPLGEHIVDIFPGLPYKETSSPEGVDVHYADRDYTAFITATTRNQTEISVIHLVDDTDMKRFSYEYYQSQPSVALVLVDNYEEMVQDYKDRERSQIMSEIENEIDSYFTANSGFVTKISTNRYMVVIQERGVKKIVHQKFDLLDRIRKIQIDGKMNPTLSIGIGRGADTLYEAEEMAKQALDMCLGRGGDQVTVRTQSGYDFFGGISTGFESRTKVKTRIIASALAELIESSGNVIIMGHRFADLDSLGAAVGMLKAVRSMNRPGFICIDNEKNLVQSMLERLKENGYSDRDFRSPENAMQAVNHDTLLIIVDVHVPHMLESEELYEACKNVVVIDHHRKLIGYIDDAAIFYHEPFASSASEMVTELIQYFPSQTDLGKAESEALLAGITLDTKNFVMKTGVRTFEAAAYLRRFGADTVAVRSMFASSMESYRQKAAIVARADVYLRCAIADVEQEFDGVRIVASQAADDLMNIAGVDASFVLYEQGNEVNVSARSMGRVNVQLIMESLGGGGHHTMAAAQFENETLPDIRDRVIDAINAYYETLPIEQRPQALTAAETEQETPTHIATEAVALQDKAAASDEEVEM